MAQHRILVTGGAGFIGSHLADALLARGHHVRALDALVAPVHGKGRVRPAYLAKEVELVIGDVRDADVVRSALAGIDAVVHFAARVGVGQSMYELHDYVANNNRGTAVLLEQIARRPVARLLVASSMSVYGEGSYRRVSGEVECDVARKVDDLRRGNWDPVDSEGRALLPLATPETKPVAPTSPYALTKYDQERMCLIMGRAYGVPTVALRFFNVYGTRQALSNPYTGVLAIFAARLLNDNRPLLFEDGLQTRDFVHVSDVIQACVLALEVESASGHVFNVGNGKPHTIRDISRALAESTRRPELSPRITGKYRVGDIRHCFADISHAAQVLGYRPKVTLQCGLEELAAWLVHQNAVDRVDEAYLELSERGLVT